MEDCPVNRQTDPRGCHPCLSQPSVVNNATERRNRSSTEAEPERIGIGQRAIRRHSRPSGDTGGRAALGSACSRPSVE